MSILLFFSCSKKNSSSNFTPLPAEPVNIEYSVFVKVDGFVYGEVSPMNSTMIHPGGSFDIHIKTKNDSRISSVSTDAPGNPIIVGQTHMGIDTVVSFKNINSNFNVKVVLTDSLTLAQLDSMNNAILGTWYYVADSLGASDRLLTLAMLGGDSSGNRNWTAVAIPPCWKDWRLIFTDENAKEYSGAYQCDTFPVNSLYGSWTWKINYNGKRLYLQDNDGTYTHILFNLTPTRIEMCDSATLYGNGDWLKFTFAHSP